MYHNYCFALFENCVSKKTIKNDAGEARDPSGKMRSKKCRRQHPALLKSDLCGASYGNFTETILYMLV